MKNLSKEIILPLAFLAIFSWIPLASAQYDYSAPTSPTPPTPAAAQPAPQSIPSNQAAPMQPLNTSDSNVNIPSGTQAPANTYLGVPATGAGGEVLGNLWMLVASLFVTALGFSYLKLKKS